MLWYIFILMLVNLLQLTFIQSSYMYNGAIWVSVQIQFSSRSILYIYIPFCNYMHHYISVVFNSTTGIPCSLICLIFILFLIWCYNGHIWCNWHLDTNIETDNNSDTGQLTWNGTKCFLIFTKSVNKLTQFDQALSYTHFNNKIN